METFEAIEKRRTCRRYINSPIEWEKVGNVLLAGSMAPSAGNVQDWKFVVVTIKDKRRAIADACLKQFWMEEAPVHIVVCGEPKKCERFYGLRGEKLYSIQNCAAAVQNMLISATDQGLASAWIGAFDEDKLVKAVNIPSYARPQAVITLGYPAEEPVKPAKFRLVDLVFLNSWGDKVVNDDLVLNDWSEVIRKKIDLVKQIIEDESKSVGSDIILKGKKILKDLIEKSKAKSKTDNGPDSKPTSKSDADLELSNAVDDVANVKKF